MDVCFVTLNFLEPKTTVKIVIDCVWTSQTGDKHVTTGRINQVETVQVEG